MRVGMRQTYIPLNIRLEETRVNIKRKEIPSGEKLTWIVVSQDDGSSKARKLNKKYCCGFCILKVLHKIDGKVPKSQHLRNAVR